MLKNYVTSSRDKSAALAFMKKALKRHGSTEAITTDGLRSYGAALDELGCRDRQEIGRWANNRVENSHLPFRRRERAILRFRRLNTLQKFAAVRTNIHNQFTPERHLVDRQTYKERRSAALAEWQVPASYAIAQGIAKTDSAEKLGAVLKPLRKGRQPAITDLVPLRKMIATAEQDYARPVTRLALRFLALTAVRPRVQTHSQPEGDCCRERDA